MRVRPLPAAAVLVAGASAGRAVSGVRVEGSVRILAQTGRPASSIGAMAMRSEAVRHRSDVRAVGLPAGGSDR
jgi:hypothetical protein